LADDIAQLRGEGFDLIVSLLTPEETHDLGLDLEKDLSRKHGLEFSNVPIVDMGVPDSMEETLVVLNRLERALSGGCNVAVHCRQGIGRSGLLAAALLVVSGLEPDTAVQRVSAARGLDIPETREQKEWVIKLAREFAEPTIHG
jgi:protein-tyrosine phosphatase